MNYRMLLYVIGKLLRTEGLLMILPMIVAIIYRENTWMSFAVVIICLLLISLLLVRNIKENSFMRQKDGFVCVGIAWILLAVFGALPFYISGQIPSYTDAFFETVSGFTTTGSSILNDIEALDKGMLFWRSFTNWIGGMGVLVFLLAILPQSDIKSSRMMHAMRAESPGPTVGKLVPKLKHTARIMYGMYIALTTLEIILLMIGKMPLFDAVVTTFANAGTGGFSVMNASIAAYDSVYIEIVISIFMIIFGINFGILYMMITGNIIAALKSEELRWYLGIIFASIAVITINILNVYDNIGTAIRNALFAVATLASSTGFVTADFNEWPPLSQIILVFIMFIGSCAGSTGGGLKISRLIILVKSGLREIKYTFQPNAVYSIRFEGKPLENDTIRNITAYFIIYIMMFSGILLAFTAAEECDIVTAFTAVTTTYNNMGPGLNEVGPVENFSHLTDLSKLILCFSMIAGRLELFPILMLFSASSRKKF
ncbi:MAG: TrkH family potassium uptake protein [Ruminococcus sp.]|nr:TrkH family potassium uptake protein [Ruminococcus sp.]